MKTLAMLVVAMMAVGCADREETEFHFTSACEGWGQGVERCQKACAVASQSIDVQTGPECSIATQHFEDGHEENDIGCNTTFEYEGLSGCCLTDSRAPGDVFFLRCE